MAGHLRPHGNRWQLLWKVDNQQFNASWPRAGQRETRLQAERRLAMDIARCLSGQRRHQPSERLVTDLVDLWLESRAFQRANTIRRMSSQLARLTAEIGLVKANELEPWMLTETVKRFRQEGLKNSTIRQYLAPVKTIYRWARKERLVERDVALYIEDWDLPARGEVEYHICEWDELLRLLDHLERRQASQDAGAGRAAATGHWIRSGARPGEICGLSWANVHLEASHCELVQKTVRARGRGAILEPVKTKRGERRLGLSSTVRATLLRQRAWQTHWRWKMRDRWQNAYDLVYTTHLGHPLTADDIWREVKRACDALGLAPFRPYDLRHAWKSHMRASTDWSADDLSTYQGHTKEVGEGVYRHPTRDTAKTRRIADDFEALEQAARTALRGPDGASGAVTTAVTEQAAPEAFRAGDQAKSNPAA